jgi:hypothetical protein
MAEDIYVIDTSSLIEIKPEHYPFDIYITMWRNLENLIRNGRLISHEKVLDELKEYQGKKDKLLEWAYNHKTMFKPTTPQQIEIVRNKILVVDNFRALIDYSKPTGDTDVFIIALALEKQKTLFKTLSKKIVVTQEQIKGNKIKIPFVCKYFKIECINVFEMFRREGWKW